MKLTESEQALLIYVGFQNPNALVKLMLDNKKLTTYFIMNSINKSCEREMMDRLLSLRTKINEV